MFSDRKKWTREGMLAYCNRQMFSFICLLVCLHFWLWMHITEWIILILWSAVITGPVRLLIDLLNYFLLLFPISISVPFSTLKTLALDYLMCSLDRALWQQILRWEAACRFIRVLLWDTRGRKWGQWGLTMELWLQLRTQLSSQKLWIWHDPLEFSQTEARGTKPLIFLCQPAIDHSL